MAPGLYQFDFTYWFGTASSTIHLEVFDTVGNVVKTIRMLNTTNWNRINLPIARGQGFRLIRETTDGSLQAATIIWTYLSPYRSNDPLSLASPRVQATEPTTLGQTTPSSVSATPSVTPVEVGGDGGAGSAPSGDSGGGDSGSDGSGDGGY
jgi:hypothetical protein